MECERDWFATFNLPTANWYPRIPSCCVLDDSNQLNGLEVNLKMSLKIGLKIETSFANLSCLKYLKHLNHLTHSDHGPLSQNSVGGGQQHWEDVFDG